VWLISEFIELDRLRSRENRQEALGCRKKSIPERRNRQPVFVVGPEEEGELLERFAGNRCSIAGLELAEGRLKGMGFTKGEEGDRISYRREMIGYRLYADPCPVTRIDIYVYPAEKEGMKRKRRSGSPFPVLVGLPNTWKRDLEEKLALKIRKCCHE